MPQSATPPGYPVIYAFGDSLSDAGDAYLLTSSSLSSQLGLSGLPVSPPYFQENYGGTTANVFSNGPVWVQLLAQAMGAAIPAPGQVGVTAQTLITILQAQGGTTAQGAAATVAALEAAQHATGSNPYLQINAGAPGGTDFAIGGSVTGPTGENSSASVPLSDLAAQFANFQAEVPAPVAGALYTVWSGSNDLLNLATDANFASLEASGAAAADVTASVANEIAMVSSLVANGAQSVLVLNVPDLGKVPEVTKSGSAAEEAAASALAASFNQTLATALANTSFGTAHVFLEDTYGLIDGAIANPAQYGLTNVTDPVYTGSLSQDDGTIVSTDPATQNQYLFFDNEHPTQTGHAFLAQQAGTLIGGSGAEAGLAVQNTTTNQPVPASVFQYTGPVSGLEDQYINITADNLNISASTPNWFLHSGSGMDAIAASSGTNVLDGGTGSNFLTGGSGSDTFFVDDRGPAASIWDTINNFHAGDATTIWGVTASNFALAWADDQGAAGYTGLTAHITAAGQPTASLTIVGYTVADLTNGRLSVSYGVDSASGSSYMYVHGNG